MKPNLSVHLEGMGLLGSMLAWQLWERGIPFTWHDINSRFVAWEASSGLIYPTGEASDMRDYQVWSTWYAGNAPWAHEPRIRRLVERSAFWFASQTPPNGARYSILRDVGCVRRGVYPAYNFNVPQFVIQTRDIFKYARRSERPAESALIVAHGTGSPLLHHYVWGWTARAELAIDPVLLEPAPRDDTIQLRPTFYLRTSRFKFSYANALPGDPNGWIAGSSHIVQKEAHHLAIGGKVHSWIEHFEQTLQGMVQVTAISDPIVGWRPAPHSNDGFGTAVLRSDNVIRVPPMTGNGVRLSPSVCEAVLRRLEEIA